MEKADRRVEEGVEEGIEAQEEAGAEAVGRLEIKEGSSQCGMNG